MLDDEAALHDGHAVCIAAHQVEVVRDQQEAHAGLRAQFVEEIEDLQADRRIERGRRFVRNQELGVAGQGHGDHCPLALAAGELVRITAGAPLGLFDAHAAHGCDRPGARLLDAQRFMQAQRLANLVADRMHGVERRHGLLEHHRDVAAAQCVQARNGHLQHILAVENHLAFEARSVEKAHQGQRGHCFSRARFAHQRQPLSLRERKRHALDYAARAERDA